jgi:hypothetical protein
MEIELSERTRRVLQKLRPAAELGESIEAVALDVLRMRLPEVADEVGSTPAAQIRALVARQEVERTKPENVEPLTPPSPREKMRGEGPDPIRETRKYVVVFVRRSTKARTMAKNGGRQRKLGIAANPYGSTSSDHVADNESCARTMATN